MSYSQSLPGNQNTDLVTFTIKVNGNVISTQYKVTAINVIKETNRIPSARLIIYDGDVALQDFEVSNEETFVPGAAIEIKAGYHSDEETIFKGIIIKHSLKIRTDRSPALILDCRDNSVKMTIARKSKYFYDQKDSDAIEEIAGSYGLDTDIESTSVQYKAIVQYDSTDWDFAVTRAEANGKIFLVNDGKITMRKPVLNNDTVLDAVFGATILELDADIDVRNQYAGMQATSWDKTNQAITSVEANDPQLAENGNLSAATLSGVFGITENLFVSEQVTENELQEWADARMSRAKLSRCRGRVKFQGYAKLFPGDLINIGGVGDRFNGKVFISGVHHEITNGNWTTDAQFGLANELFLQKETIHSSSAASMMPAIQGLQIGVVTKLENDPDGQDRIQVRLPIIDAGDDGIWMRMACMDAGNNRGTFFRPEIGDEVITGFVNNDPRDAVVLGMMNSSAKPAALKASDQNDEKGYVSRSGMKMIFNDSDKSIKIETPAGKKITVSEADGIIKLEDENGNKISMESSAVNIESAADMTIKAAGNLTIEAANISLSPSSSFSLGSGSASMSADAGSISLSAPSLTVEGSGVATIKGGIVKIN